MRRTVINFVSKSKYFFLCLLFICLFQACAPKKSFVVSMDVIHQKFYGPLYPNPSPNEGEPGVNVQYYYEFGGWLPPGIHAGNSAKSNPLDKLYTSTDKGPAGVINPLKDNAADNADDFKYHIFFGTGPELALKRSSDASLAYLQVPFYALYRYNLSDGGSIFGGLGPYAAVGFAGSAFTAENGFSRFDAGLGFTAGYTITDSFSFGADYELGLADIQKGVDGGKAQNRGFVFKVGYPLDKLVNKIKGK